MEEQCTSLKKELRYFVDLYEKSKAVFENGDKTHFEYVTSKKLTSTNYLKLIGLIEINKKEIIELEKQIKTERTKLSDNTSKLSETVTQIYNPTISSRKI